MLPKTFRGANLDPLRRRDVAGDPTLDHDRDALDLGVHYRALADDEGILCRNLALDLPLDATRALAHELAGDPAALAEERTRGICLQGRDCIPLTLEHLLHLPGWRRNGAHLLLGPRTFAARPSK